MEARRAELQEHTKNINSVLQDVCAAHDPAPFVNLIEGTITIAASCPPALRRQVTTDLGIQEVALRLPIPEAGSPRFWIAMHERWEWISKHKAGFRQCGLRLYIGERSEEAVQFLRLEWVAPTLHGGVPSYEGAHAGHPHWHVDSAALIGPERVFQSLEALTAPSLEKPEAFSDAIVADSSATQALLDFSWLQNLHLPARAQWMSTEWDGSRVPGPHQCEPNNLDELVNWWAGALRYISAELST